MNNLKEGTLFERLL